MSLQESDVIGEFTILQKKWKAYATAANPVPPAAVNAELNAIITGLGADTTTHSHLIETPPAATKHGPLQTPFTNQALLIVNKAKGGNVPNATIAAAIGDVIGVAHAPAPVTAPYVSGTNTVGSTLSSTTGTWDGAPTSYAYQWLRDGGAIAAATAATYLLVAADSKHGVACRVTATNATGTGPGSVSNSVQIA
jgi:hypothetical protein